MSALHEVLAVEGDLKNQLSKVKEETLNTLKKPAVFQARVTRLTMVKPGLDLGVKESMEAAGSSQDAMGTTVTERLKFHAGFLAKLANHRFQKDLTNTKAKADIVIAGETIFANVPATTLLSLEDLLTEQRAIYDAIPTLDIKKDWEAAPDIGPNVYKTKSPVVNPKTEKDFHHRELVKPTQHHPAQIEKWSVDITVGHSSVTEYSGMWTSARKAEVLKRTDTLIAAVKQARARANQQEVEQGGDLAKALLDYMQPASVTEIRVGN